MPRKKQIPAVRPSAYPGARLDSITWRSMFGATFRKPNAIAPYPFNNKSGQPSSNGGSNIPAHRRADEKDDGTHHLTFLQNFGLLGVPILVVICTSAAWTTWLLILNVAPNATANYLMNTAEFDNGSFWLIIDPEPAQIAAAVCGLAVVLSGYMYALLKMTWWMNTDLPDSTSSAVVAAITRVIVCKSSTRQQIQEFWSELTGFHGPRRKFWNLWLKAIDLILQVIALQNILELGFPTDLCYGYSVLIAVNSLSCVVTTLTPDRHSAFKEILIDSTFDMLFAVMAPLIAIVYSYYNFEFERERFLMYLELAPPSSVERQARIMADPAQISLFRISFDELRLRTPLDFAIRIGMNLSFCYRLKRVIEVRIRQRRKLFYRNEHAPPSIRPPTQKSVSKYMVLPFITLGVFVLIFTHRCIDSSNATCAPYSECVAHAHRLDNDGLCPCLILIDVDRAPKTYNEWMNPVNVTSTVQELAASGDLQVFQLINRHLPEWPEELQRCTNLQHMNIAGRPNDTTLVRMPEDLFESMSALTFIKLSSHPLLESLPPLDGLVHLKSLILVALTSLDALPSFRSLHNLERLELMKLSNVKEIPDLESQTQLAQFVLEWVPACCTGFIGACDLTEELCKAESTCVDGAAVSAGRSARMTQILQEYDSQVCTKPTTADSGAAKSPERSSIDACGGVLYRQCGQHNGTGSASVEAMCYNAQLQVISCSPMPSNIAIRRMEIQKDVGAPCDPVEEAWLGCPSQ